MITFKNSKIQISIILAVEFLMGVYIALTRINTAEAPSLFSVFSQIREGMGIDITSQLVDINILISILNVIISVPLISSLFNKKYLAKCCYIATRQKSYFKFYIREIINIFLVCVLSAVLYNAGILTVTFFKHSNIFDSADINLFFTAVANSIVIVFTVTILGALISALLNDKIGIIITSIFIAVLSLSVFFIPYEFKQFNIISWYFTDLFINEKALFPYPIYTYYLAVSAIDIILLLIGGGLLKKRDVL